VLVFIPTNYSRLTRLHGSLIRIADEAAEIY